MDMFVKMVNSANTFLWNVILILLLCGTGIYYTLRLKFVQIREFKQGLKQVFGGIGKKHEKKEGEMSLPFNLLQLLLLPRLAPET